MIFHFALKRYSCHEILRRVSFHATRSYFHIISEVMSNSNIHPTSWLNSRLTHVFAKVLNLNCLSRAVPSLASVHRPPFEVSKAFSAGVTFAASVPAENFGWDIVEEKRNKDEMRVEWRRGRIVCLEGEEVVSGGGLEMRLKGLSSERRKRNERRRSLVLLAAGYTGRWTSTH